MTETSDKPKGKSLTPQEMGLQHVHLFGRYVTDTGKILPRQITGLNAKQQRHITRVIKQARNMLMMQ
jgi:small subunit ribosomal protein S18